MKRFRSSIILGLFLIVFAIPPQVSHARELDLAPNAKSAVLMDMDTGTVLFEKNADEKMPPASITKIMTMLLVMEALDQGKIKLTDKVRTSERAASMGGSQIFLEPGEEMTVEELLKGVAVASGNDASVALAEYIAGTEEAFVEMMNEKAKELGMTNTHFVNSNGLPAPDHYSTARDIAIMSRALLRYENITKYTGIYQDYLRKDTDNPFWLVNTNRLVRFYPGVDGLKTGYTSEAMFCLSATAKKGDFRVIAVVMGEPNSKLRNKEVTQMLDYAFSQFTNHVLYKKDEEIATVRVDKGKTDVIRAVTPHQFSILSKKGEKITDFEQVVDVEEMIHAPVEKGQTLGKLIVKKDGKVISQIDLVAAESCERANTWEMMKKTLRSMITF